MTRYERTELAKALLEAAGSILEATATHHTDRLTLEDIHKLMRSKIPNCFTADPEWRDDQNAWYEAKERWLATGEYSNTGKNCNIFYDGWNAARDHYQNKGQCCNEGGIPVQLTEEEMEQLQRPPFQRPQRNPGDGQP